MNRTPFTAWNIDEVVADVVATSAKRFTPDNQREVQKVVDWISDDFGYYLDKSVICSPAELLEDATQARADNVQSFMEASNLQNWFGEETRSDCLFFWTAVVLFYQRLVDEGFTAIATDQPPGTTVKGNSLPVPRLPSADAQADPRPAESFDSFTDLFIDPADIDPCIEALRKYRPEKPVLGEGLTWVGGPKNRGLIVAWIETMELTKRPKIRHLKDRKKLVRLLNTYFSSLNMGKYARVFDEPTNRNAKDRFAALMAK